jgi:hypothetical protein
MNSQHINAMKLCGIMNNNNRMERLDGEVRGREKVILKIVDKKIITSAYWLSDFL